MNPVLVAALVAGVVSLAGVLANLYIARQGRRTTLLQMKMQVLASDASQSSELIKTLITETERVRISCWNLLGHLHQVELEFADHEPIQPAKEILAEALQGYFRAARGFKESWAPVKGEVPLGMEKYIRTARHDSIHMLNNVGAQIERLLRVMDRDPKLDDISRGVRHSQDALHELLAALDQFISLARSMNEANLNERLLIA